MGVAALVFVLDVFVTGLCARFACVMRGYKIPLTRLLAMLFISTTFALIPYVGFVLSIGVFITLLLQFTDIDAPEAVWIVIIAKMLTLAILVMAGVTMADRANYFLNFP